MLFWRLWLAKLGVVRPLCSALRGDNRQLGVAAAKALARIRRVNVVEPLCDALLEACPEVARAAAEALAEQKDPRSVQALCSALERDKAAVDSLLQLVCKVSRIEKPSSAEDLPENVRQAFKEGAQQIAAAMKPVKVASAVALGNLHDSRAVAALCACLGDSDSALRSAAATSLGEIGDREAGWTLYRRLGDEEGYGVIRDLARALVKLGLPYAVRGHVYLLTSGDLQERLAAKDALCKAGDEGVQQLELLATSMCKSELACAAALALGEVRSAKAADVLQKILRNESLPSRHAAAQALTKCERPICLWGHAWLLGIGTADEVKAAEAAIQSAGAAAVDALLDALSCRDAKVRQHAAQALGPLRDNRAVAPLCAALDDSDLQLQIAAARALGVIGDTEAVEPLMKCLDEHQVHAAAAALGHIGDRRAVGLLIRLLGSGCGYQMRAELAVALGQLHDPQAIPPLTRILLSKKGVVGSERAAAARSLQALGACTTPEMEAWCAAAESDWSRCVSMGRTAVEPVLTAFEHGGFEGGIEQITDTLARIGDARAVPALVQALSAEEPARRQAAARALVVLFRHQQLDDRSKQAILSQRQTIEEPHHDVSKPSDCTHSDRGIGVTF